MWGRAEVARLVVVACLLGLLVLVFVPQATPLPYLEYWTADWRTAFLSDRADGKHAKIAVVFIDDKTLEPYPYISPTDRGLLAEVVRDLDQAGAAVIALDFYFAKATEPDKDAELVDALRTAKAKVVLGFADNRVGLNETQRTFQDAYLAKIDRPEGYLNLRHDADEVVRYKPRPANNPTVPESFAQAVAKAAGAPISNGTTRIAWLLPASGTSPFLTVSAYDLIAASRIPTLDANKDLLAKFKNRIVLVGVNRPFIDRHRTPLGMRGDKAIPGILVHAQMVAELIDGRHVTELTFRQEQLLVLGLWFAGCAIGWISAYYRFNFARWTVWTVLFIAIDVVLFAQWRLVLPFTLGLAAWALGVTTGNFLTKSKRAKLAKDNQGSVS